MSSITKRNILFYIMVVPVIIITIILLPVGKGIDFTIWMDKKLNKWSGYNKLK